MPGITWAEMLRVMVGEECPSSSLTTFIGTPEASMSDAAVCLQSWSLIGGSSAVFTRSSKRSDTIVNP
jgi:hypothetical protein